VFFALLFLASLLIDSLFQCGLTDLLFNNVSIDYEKPLDGEWVAYFPLNDEPSTAASSPTSVVVDGCPKYQFPFGGFPLVTPPIYGLEAMHSRHPYEQIDATGMSYMCGEDFAEFYDLPPSRAILSYQRSPIDPLESFDTIDWVSSGEEMDDGPYKFSIFASNNAQTTLFDKSEDRSNNSNDPKEGSSDYDEEPVIDVNSPRALRSKRKATSFFSPPDHTRTVCRKRAKVPTGVSRSFKNVLGNPRTAKLAGRRTHNITFVAKQAYIARVIYGIPNARILKSLGYYYPEYKSDMSTTWVNRLVEEGLGLEPEWVKRVARLKVYPNLGSSSILPNTCNTYLPFVFLFCFCVVFQDEMRSASTATSTTTNTTTKKRKRCNEPTRITTSKQPKRAELPPTSLKPGLRLLPSRVKFYTIPKDTVRKVRLPRTILSHQKVLTLHIVQLPERPAAAGSNGQHEY
jgi:hypothetical protein